MLQNNLIGVQENIPSLDNFTTINNNLVATKSIKYYDIIAEVLVPNKRTLIKV
mgnify:CR=1 FL=1